MRTLDRLYNLLRFPDAALRLARGEFAEELGTLVTAPFETVGHPPALVPLYMVDDPTIVGWWVDPFGIREPAIVECVPTEGYRVVERFRTWEQLALYLVVHRIVAGDGVDAAPLAKRLGVDPEQAARVAKSVGDDEQSIGWGPRFADDPPFELDANAYRGQWPFAGRESDLRHVSGLELTADRQRVLKTDVNAPPWLVTTRQPELFSSLLVSRQYESAWRSLNSPGWLFEDAKHALQRLARAAGNEVSREIADVWCAEPHEQFGGYGRTDRRTWWGDPDTSPFGVEQPSPARLPTRLTVTLGSEHAPDSPLGEQAITIDEDGSLHYSRAQRGERWERRAGMPADDAREILSMLALTPFPAVARHRVAPGATGVRIQARYPDGRDGEASFGASAPEVAVYWELLERVQRLAGELSSVAQQVS